MKTTAEKEAKHRTDLARMQEAREAEEEQRRQQAQDLERSAALKVVAAAIESERLSLEDVRDRSGLSAIEYRALTLALVEF